MVFCPKCGQENQDGIKYCKYCGSSMDSLGSRQPRRVAKANNSIGFGSRRTGEDLVIRCSLCGGRDFAKDTGRLDSKWGFTSFKVVMLTCKNCGHIELFNKGRSIFDFD
ncbi:MAG: double zinc ribbon domain-containing protein [Candidatus Hodarchaeales archaeon]